MLTEYIIFILLWGWIYEFRTVMLFGELEFIN